MNADDAAARLAEIVETRRTTTVVAVRRDYLAAVLEDRAELVTELTELKAALVELKPLRHASDDPVEIYRKGRLDGAAELAAELDRLKANIESTIRAGLDGELFDAAYEHVLRRQAEDACSRLYRSEQRYKAELDRRDDPSAHHEDSKDDE